MSCRVGALSLANQAASISAESVPYEPSVVQTPPMQQQQQQKPAAEVIAPTAAPGLVALHRLWCSTQGSLSLDIRRPQFKEASAAAGDTLLRRAARPPPARGPRRGSGPPQYGAFVSAPAAPPPPSWGPLPSLAFMSTGARVKAMRHLQFGPRWGPGAAAVVAETADGEAGTPGSSSGGEGGRGQRGSPAFDLGVGLAFEVDTAELRPMARLKFQDVLSIKAFPYPALKIQKRITLPGSDCWGVRLSYECPWDGLAAPYRPPARLLVCIDSEGDRANGVRLTQAGLEFSADQSFIGGKTRVRAAGLITMPRELPLEEGQPLVGLEVKRLGLKARW